MTQEISLAIRDLQLSHDQDDSMLMLYVELLRHGKVTVETLQKAAFHGDPTAIKLSGMLPGEPRSIKCEEDFQKLSELPLKNLQLSHFGSLSSEAMSWIGRLPLENLAISWADKIVDADFRHFVAMPLKKLEIDKCEGVTGSCFQWLKHLDLEDLSIECLTIFRDGGKFQDSHFIDLENLALRKLSLQVSRTISSKAVSCLNGSRLEALELSYLRNIKSADLQTISAWPLKKLAFNSCDINADNLRFFEHMPIESLTLGGTDLSDESMKSIKALPLKKLSLSCFDTVTESGFAKLKGCELEDLVLKACTSGDGVAALGEMPLRSLSMWLIDIVSDSHLNQLLSPYLHSLKLDSIDHFTGQALKDLQSELESLVILSCPEFSGKSLRALEFSSLKHFGLSDVGDVSYSDLAFLANCPLETLDLSYGTISDCSQLEFLSDLPLKQLDLSGMVIGDNDLDWLTGSTLKSLHLNWMVKLGKGLFERLQGTTIEHLELEGCQHYMRNGDLDGLRNLPLRSLSLRDCGDFTLEALRFLKDMELDLLDLTHWGVGREEWNRVLTGSELAGLIDEL